MPDAIATRFSCDACGKTYAWKAELAGKRAKCKCGSVMTVPDSVSVAEPPPPPQDDESAMYDVAPTGEEVAKPKKSPRVPLAPLKPRNDGPARSGQVPGLASAGVSMSVGGPALAPGVAQPLGYRTGATQREKDRLSKTTLLDKNRDIHVPIGLLIAGFALYVGYYAYRYDMSASGVAMTTIGVALMTLIKAGLLIGFALVAAGPLGVSFGGIYTAALKLAAVAVFSDGVATWVDAGVAKMSGAGGAAFAGMISFPIVLGVYWTLLIYLFSMDAGDSWMVVVILSVFDTIARWAILLILLNVVLSWSGSSAAISSSVSSTTSSLSSSAAKQAAWIDDLKDAKLLKEARQYIADGHQGALSKAVDEWYAAGCKNIWFEVSRDINGRGGPEQLIVELPKDKKKRADCYKIFATCMKEVYAEDVAPGAVKDTGDPYLQVPVR